MLSSFTVIPFVRPMSPIPGPPAVLTDGAPGPSTDGAPGPSTDGAPGPPGAGVGARCRPGGGVGRWGPKRKPAPRMPRTGQWMWRERRACAWPPLPGPTARPAPRPYDTPAIYRPAPHRVVWVGPFIAPPVGHRARREPAPRPYDTPAIYRPAPHRVVWVGPFIAPPVRPIPQIRMPA